jgi:hypothetical protein
MAKRNVLITGASGYLAEQLLPVFREKYNLTLLDVRKQRKDGTVVEDVIEVDLIDHDLEKYRKHFKGIDTVVHLGYKGNTFGDFRRATFFDEFDNVRMAYNIYEVTLQEDVRRVVMASSNHAADWYEHQLIRPRKLDMLTPDFPAKSDNYYGWAKLSYEALGFVYASGHRGRKLEVIQLRIGAPRPIDVKLFKDNPLGYKRDLGAYLSERDWRQLVMKSIETENIADEHGIPFQIFYGISDNSRAFWSIANARKVIGYQPEEDSEVTFAEDIRQFLTGEKPKPGKL